MEGSDIMPINFRASGTPHTLFTLSYVTKRNTQIPIVEGSDITPINFRALGTPHTLFTFSLFEIE